MLGLPTVAFAGGFEFPDNGTEALGRGGAFTAKADSPLAIEYNIGGLAKQRGTKLLFDSNLRLPGLHVHSARATIRRRVAPAACAAVQRPAVPLEVHEPRRGRSTRRSSA